MKPIDPVLIPTPVASSFTGTSAEFTRFTVANSALAAPYALEMAHALLAETEGASRLVLTELEHESRQAYRIQICPEQVTIAGASDVAFIYAMSTLLQLADVGGDRIVLPEGEICDHPGFEYRGVNWNLFVETRGWSQDAGDGLDALVDRFISGLDTLAFFKLNVAFVDGFGWNPERFPGYGELMRKLNREACHRGVKLVFGGYNAGYGAQWRDFDGPSFQNRASYPDGEVYSCLDPLRCSEIGSTMGTCLNNPALLKLKAENLVDYVKAVEPGMLYIHGIDIAAQDECDRAWAARCPRCRERWPNDAVNAADGMAGAFASFYDDLYEAIASAETPESGYSAARDCIVHMVSPNYTNYYEDDEEWLFHVDYFRTLSECLRNKTVRLTFREQFFDMAGGRPRFAQLFDALDKDCKCSVVYFSSGSSFYNSLPATADAACVRYFDGMDTVIIGGGTAFQEPRQGITAEYLWNPHGSAFSIDLPDTAAQKEFLQHYHDLAHGRELPEAVFGAEGLLQCVCEKLYGGEAGRLAAELQHLHSLPGTAIVAAPLAPAVNQLLPGSYFSILKGNRGVRWRAELSEDLVATAKQCVELMPHLARQTEAAVADYRQAAACCESELPLRPDMRKAHLERMAETCAVTARIADFAGRWLQVFLNAREAMEQAAGKDALLPTIDELCRELEQFGAPLRELAEGTIDPNQGDPGQVVCTIDSMLADLGNIRHTLTTGEYRAVEVEKWW